MKNCNQCNAPIIDMYNYCPNCGYKLKNTIPTKEDEYINISNPYQGKNEIIVGKILILMAILIIIIGFISSNTIIQVAGVSLIIPSTIIIIIGKSKYWYNN